MAIVISDTTAIRALAFLNRVDLLPTLFDQVLVPPEVDAELRSPPGDLPVVDVRQFAFVKIQAPNDQKKVRELKRVRDPGESEALALELGVGAILIEESAGRSMAKRLGLSPIGVLGLLVRAQQRGLVTLVHRLLDQLENDLGFFISRSLRSEILRLAGEP